MVAEPIRGPIKVGSRGLWINSAHLDFQLQVRIKIKSWSLQLANLYFNRMIWLTIEPYLFCKWYMGGSLRRKPASHGLEQACQKGRQT